MIKFLMNFISILFIPLLVPIYLFVILAIYYDTLLGIQFFQNKLFFLGLIFCFTFILPSIAIFISFKTNLITDLGLNSRKERLFPQIYTLISYSYLSYLFFTKEGLQSFSGMCMATITISVLAITVITLFWKISAHAAGISGIVGMLFALNPSYPLPESVIIVSILIFLIGWVMTARLYLNVHTPLQVTLGMILGFFMGFFALSFGIN